jgi:hypothetical protein
LHCHELGKKIELSHRRDWIGDLSFYCFWVVADWKINNECTFGFACPSWEKGKEEEEEVRVFLAGFMLLLHSHEDSIRGKLSFVSLFQKFLSILLLLFHQKWKHAHTHTCTCMGSVNFLGFVKIDFLSICVITLWNNLFFAFIKQEKEHLKKTKWFIICYPTTWGVCVPLLLPDLEKLPPICLSRSCCFLASHSVLFQGLELQDSCWWVVVIVGSVQSSW